MKALCMSNPKPALKKPRRPTQQETLDALKAESDRQFTDHIGRGLAMPIEKRMNFLRKRLPGGGSCLLSAIGCLLC